MEDGPHLLLVSAESTKRLRGRDGVLELEADPYDRHQRAARNQSMIREVNEKIEGLVRGGNSTLTEFSCECADDQCREVLSLTVEEYEHIRRIPTHFLVVPGHHYADVERVVEAESASGRYEVVEKFGEAGTLSVRLDPRSRPSLGPSAYPSDLRTR